jgi:hypothetical protein
MTRGRPPAATELGDRLDGSSPAKARLHAVLESLTGQRTVAEAACRLGLSERRLHTLRLAALQAALGSLEPRPVGRRARAPEANPRLAALEAEVHELRLEREAARIRAELAVTLPHVLTRTGSKKKSRTRGTTARACKSGTHVT